jgi:hypothetical protein
VQTGVSRVIDDEKPPGQVWTPAAVKMVMDIVNKHIDGYACIASFACSHVHRIAASWTRCAVIRR